MRSVVIGAVGSTLVTLKTLQKACMPPAAVFTVTEDIAHRNSDYVDLQPLCEKSGIPIKRFRNVNDSDVVTAVQGFHPDVLWVVGLSQLVKQPLLDVPGLGAVGFHPSKLPQNRGRGVIAWTIIQGLSETGSTLFWLEYGADTGPILRQKVFPVAGDETVSSLMKKHRNALEQMILESLPDLTRSTTPKTPGKVQDHTQATWCAKRTPDDGRIDWSRPAREVWTLVRASGRPYPGAFSGFRRQQATIWSADLEEGFRGRYWGFPGQVQAFHDGLPLVQCGDGNHILLKEITFRGEEEILELASIRLHERFGGHGDVR